MESIKKLVTERVETLSTCNISRTSSTPQKTITESEKIEFLKKYNPSLQISLCRNPQKCIYGKSITLSESRIIYGKNIAEIWIANELKDFSEFVGVKQKMDERQIDEVSSIILNEYFYLKLSEFMLFFYRMKMGEYGEFYGCVDAIKILRSLKIFIRERNDLLSKMEQKKMELKNEEDVKNAISYEEWKNRKILKNK